MAYRSYDYVAFGDLRDVCGFDDELQRVIQSMDIGLSGDLLAEDLRMVIEHLAEITGEEKITPQETLNSIFSSYCIGK